MKRILLVLVAISTILFSVGCSQEDATTVWSENIYPSTNNTYDIGSPILQYQDGYFVNVWASNNISATYFIGDGSQLTGIEQGDLILYFKDEASADVAANKCLCSVYNSTEVTITQAGLAGGSTLMGSWITVQGSPAKNLLLGNIRVHVSGAKTAGTKDAQYYFEIWKADENGVDIELLSTSGYTDVLTNVRTEYRLWALLDETNLNTSDRLRVKGYAYVTGGGSAPTVEAYIQGASNTRLVIPVGAISIDNFVPYTGAVNNLIYGGAIIRTDGTIQPASMANASAPNNSIFYSTGSNTLCYKDPLGNVFSLY